MSCQDFMESVNLRQGQRSTTQKTKLLALCFEHNFNILSSNKCFFPYKRSPGIFVLKPLLLSFNSQTFFAIIMC